jgi:hypothetical protein
MHDYDHAKKSKHRNDSPQYGHLQYQQFIQNNEIPDADLINELLQNSFKRVDPTHHKKHHHSRTHHKIKKLRSRLPEVGIMQKKLKVESVLGERRS